MVQWARLQPRKLQWERASRFFVRQIHKSWGDFIELVHASTPDGGVWGSPEHIAVPEPLGLSPQSRTQPKTTTRGAWETTPILSLQALRSTGQARRIAASERSSRRFATHARSPRLCPARRRPLLQTPIARHAHRSVAAWSINYA